MTHSLTAAAQSAATAVRKLSADAREARTAALRRIVEHCKEFQGADLKRSIAQASISLSIYVALVAAMIALARAGEWGFALLLSPLAGGVLVKLFTIQHDCGHGSYFKSRLANDWMGRLVSILTFTPYSFWRDAHNRHHAGSGDLERRGIGAVDTLTVEEYRALPKKERILYRLYRHPVVMILIGAPFYFFVLQRFPLASAPPFAKTYKGLSVKQIWRSVATLNCALAFVYGGLAWLFGAGAVALAILPSVTIAAWVGTWLFFVQHQYEDAYWARKPEWTYAEAAIFGSSHYHLPKVFRWFTGNIGLHHIHHLASGIPNYRLPECYRSSKDLLALPRMTFLESLNCARLALWDEAQRKMISFKALKAAA
ncbi:MAG: fatty acid desaturase [Parvularculaceae bacterium]|nr:fatty acid desaturase [Parvularculaceae bacterium]HRX40988.1 fatty acid desaturase [Parvularculaceae bacterium]